MSTELNIMGHVQKISRYVSRYRGGPYPRGKRLILDHFSAARTRRSRVPVRTKNASEISRRSFQRASARLAIRVSVCARFRVLGPEMPKKSTSSSSKQQAAAASKQATQAQLFFGGGDLGRSWHLGHSCPVTCCILGWRHHHQPLRIFGSVWRLFLLCET